jgi:hypothetical protein
VRPAVDRRADRRLDRHARAAELAALVDTDRFYPKLAELDPEHATRWQQMAQVQRAFQDAEPQYRSERQRVYSASNRETLHRLMVHLYEDKPGPGMFRRFVRAHPALFRENGAYALPLREQLQILAKVPRPMLTARIGVLLALGALRGEGRALVHEAAEETRAARKARGEPVT